MHVFPFLPAFTRRAALCLGLAFATPPAFAQAPLVPVTVQVPASMRSSPFDVTRTLNVPSGYRIAVYARIPGARFLAEAPNGDLLVSTPNAGKVEIVRRNPNGGDPLVSDFVTGLRLPHDIVFHKIGTTTYVYISESHEINRFIYQPGDLTAHDRQVVVTGLPDASSAELHGSYGHQLKNIALDSQNKLYVSIGSATNSDPSDTTANPVRAAIYQYNADGTGGRLFARGLRNAEGLAFVPGTNTLWAAVNSRDNVAYPFHQDWDGDGQDDYSRVITSYVDNHPPDEFTAVRDGGNYGWPFANPNPDTASGMDNMPFDLDVQNNGDGSHGSATSFDRLSKGIQAHSAALGLTFLQDTHFRALYRLGAVIALHGSWDRAQKTGYKVVYFPWDTTAQTPGAQADWVSGWLDNAAQTSWGRPVDTAVDAQGSLFISDDASGTVYKMASTLRFDIDGDGHEDIFWRNAQTGQLAVWHMADTDYLSAAAFPGSTDPLWQIVSTADIDGDDHPDLLWRNAQTGQLAVWYMNGTQRVGAAAFAGSTDIHWQVIGGADFDGDGHPDLLWRNTQTGQLAVWYMNGTQMVSATGFAGSSDARWQVMAASDFNGDGHPDLLWRNTQTGQVAVWYMTNTQRIGDATFATISDLNWQIVGTGDYNGDGASDILWRHSQTRQLCLWHMNGVQRVDSPIFPGSTDPHWQVVGMR